MRKTNNKASQRKAKRAQKNKKRIAANPYHQVSSFERKQKLIREGIIASYLPY
jgi:hypothetical protein